MELKRVYVGPIALMNPGMGRFAVYLEGKLKPHAIIATPGGMGEVTEISSLTQAGFELTRSCGDVAVYAVGLGEPPDVEPARPPRAAWERELDAILAAQPGEDTAESTRIRQMYATADVAGLRRLAGLTGDLGAEP